MYEIALTVSACLRAGTRVDVAWLVESDGIAVADKGEALAITPGGGRVGSVLSGALNDQLVDLSNQGKSGRRVRLRVAALAAQLAGLPGDGDAHCLMVPADELPAQLWERLRRRDPVGLLTRLDGDRVVDTAVFDAETVADAGEAAAQLFAAGVSDTRVEADTVITVLWPVPKLVIVGGGAIADALGRTADLLGWHAQVVSQPSAATGVIAGLAGLDKVVVTSHDVELAGPALAAALAGEVGYVGALGGRRMQQARAEWLAYQGVTDLSRVHGPAGLDIGAKTPAEIAISIVAEALAVNSTAGADSLGRPSAALDDDHPRGG